MTEFITYVYILASIVSQFYGVKLINHDYGRTNPLMRGLCLVGALSIHYTCVFLAISKSSK